MKITYFAMLLAATTLSRGLVAQEETPTPSLSTNSRIEKSSVSAAKPTRSSVSATVAPRYQPRPDTTLKLPPHRPRPDTTSRITPTPAPYFDPFVGPQADDWHNGAHTFENGVRVEILGDDVTFTDARGRRSVMHKHELDHTPPGEHPQGCGELLYWLTHHSPGLRKWKRLSIKYINGC
jgi:hypothetical protein